LLSLVAARRVSSRPGALGLHLEPAAQRVEFKVLTRKAEDPSVESSLRATTR